MTKFALAFFASAVLFSAVGCSKLSGDVTVEQQKAKKDALQKVADESGDPKPTRGDR